MSEARHSLIFLTYNRPELIDARLAEVDLHMGERDDIEVIVLDNGSEDYGVRLTLTSRSQVCRFPLVLPRQDKNIGFGPGFNRAVLHSTGDHIHLISSDVAIFGDLVDMVGWLDENLVVCHRRIDHPAGWNQFGKLVIPYPEGYYLSMRRSTWDYLGGFDERFVPYDYEDVDLGYRISKDEKAVLIELSNLPLKHQAASTIGYNGARHEHTVQMRSLFAEKWDLANQPIRP